MPQNCNKFGLTNPNVKSIDSMGGEEVEQVDENVVKEEEQQRQTRVVVQILGHEKAAEGSHTVYVVLVNLMSGGEVFSTWTVKRRYNSFYKLYKALHEKGFPCPEMPPKQMFTFNQSSFLKQRMAALNIWLQGTICIWQSVRLDDHRASFAISELVEEFLCEDHCSSVSTLLKSQDAVSKCSKKMGIAIRCDKGELSSNQAEYALYAGDGQSVVNQEFRPFTATVAFPNTPKDSSPNPTTLQCCCTPVSVPPTPHGQTEFLQSWSKYTETVLAYVARRLEHPKDAKEFEVEHDDDDDAMCEAVLFSKSVDDPIDQYGYALIQRLQSEADNAIDFVGSRWQLLGEERNVLVLRRTQKKKAISISLSQHMRSEIEASDEVNCFLGKGVIHAPAKKVFDLVRNPLKRHVFDRMFKYGSEKIIETFEDSNLNPIAMQFSIETKQRLYFMRHSRDVCVIQYAKEMDNGTFCVVGSSIKHDEIENANDGSSVRCNIFLYGWVIEPLDDDSCKATYIIEVDFAGGTLSKFIDTMAFRQPLCIHYVDSHFKNIKK